jgi:hypothetical protein
MDEQGSLCHTKRERKYHIVFIPLCQRKASYKELPRRLGETFRRPTVAHAVCDPAQVRGLASERVHQGEERDPACAGLRRQEKELCGPALLGAGILRARGRPGRSDGPESTSSSGSIRTNDRTRWGFGKRPQWRSSPQGGAALATPISRFERLTS